MHSRGASRPRWSLRRLVLLVAAKWAHSRRRQSAPRQTSRRKVGSTLISAFHEVPLHAFLSASADVQPLINLRSVNVSCRVCRQSKFDPERPFGLWDRQGQLSEAGQPLGCPSFHGAAQNRSERPKACWIFSDSPSILIRISTGSTASHTCPGRIIAEARATSRRKSALATRAGQFQ